jgi:GNAT superfamily N-acetyltransferase
MRGSEMSDIPDTTSDSPPNYPSPGDGLNPVNYPNELVSEFVTLSGVSLRLRPIRVDDAERLVAFHSRLSPDSIYLRYFSFHPRLTQEEVSHLTQVDYVDRLALVVEDGNDIVAIGRYDRVPSTTTGEVAFVVRDNFQHLGLGHLLLGELAKAAWNRGLTEFYAVTYLGNRWMIAVFMHSGFPVTTSHEGEELMVSFPIDPTCRSLSVPLQDPRGAS